MFGQPVGFALSISEAVLFLCFGFQLMKMICKYLEEFLRQTMNYSVILLCLHLKIKLSSVGSWIIFDQECYVEGISMMTFCRGF